MVGIARNLAAATVLVLVLTPIPVNAECKVCRLDEAFYKSCMLVEDRAGYRMGNTACTDSPVGGGTCSYASSGKQCTVWNPSGEGPLCESGGKDCLISEQEGLIATVPAATKDRTARRAIENVLEDQSWW